MDKIELKDLKKYEIKCLGFCKSKLIAIKEDLKKEGHSNHCPSWGCITCKQLFRKINLNLLAGGHSCPCHAYNKEYLIKRLTYILKHWPKKGE